MASRNKTGGRQRHRHNYGPRKRVSDSFWHASRRVCELERLLTMRAGVVLDFLRSELVYAAAHTFVWREKERPDHLATDDPLNRWLLWSSRHLPWLGRGEAVRLFNDAWENTRRFTKEALGQLLRVTAIEWRCEQFGTLAPFDLSKEEREEEALHRRRKKDRECKANLRRMKGAKPRSEYEGGSVQAICDALGWNRTGYNRARSKGDFPERFQPLISRLDHVKQVRLSKDFPFLPTHLFHHFNQAA